MKPGGELVAVACRRNLGLDGGGDRTLTVAGKGDRQQLAGRWPRLTRLRVGSVCGLQLSIEHLFDRLRACRRGRLSS